MPLLNTDGTSLTDISGYRVYYGTSATINGINTRFLEQGSQATWLAVFPPGTYYFAVATLNSMGVASDLSTPASKELP